VTNAIDAARDDDTLRAEVERLEAERDALEDRVDDVNARIKVGERELKRRAEERETARLASLTDDALAGEIGALAHYERQRRRAAAATRVGEALNVKTMTDDRLAAMANDPAGRPQAEIDAIKRELHRRRANLTRAANKARAHKANVRDVHRAIGRPTK